MRGEWFTFVCAALLVPALGLTRPDCEVLRGTTCVGFLPNTFVSGDTVEEVLQSLQDSFCGCTHVTGSIRIDMSTSESGVQLTEDDFNFFYYIEQISGLLTLQNIPQVPRIILPNLRIIRGEDSITDGAGNEIVLSVRDTEIGELIIPELREITQGSVFFENVTMCNYKTVNWTDILDDGLLIDRNLDCENFLDCRSDCSEFGFCWSLQPEVYCQPLTKKGCSCGTDRCYRPSQTSSQLQCCNPQCAAGCDGSRPDQCFACSDFGDNGTCVTQCPPRVIYDPELFQLIENPDYRLSAGNLCVEECPVGLFELSDSCVLECPTNFFATEDNQCMECEGSCPRECAGLSRMENVDRTTVERLEGCNIITSGGIYISQVTDPNFNETEYEVLSTITEIRGPLQIRGWQGVSFPYLRNLRRVGADNVSDPDSAVLTLMTCAGIEREYSMDLTNNPNLVAIDLSSLEEIVGAGVVHAVNSDLCFTGNLTARVTDPSAFNCVGSERRNGTECVADGYRCHEQCDSEFSCWGPDDTQCDGCRNFRHLRQCVENCSSIALPSSSSGLFQNAASGVCEECDGECVGGCSGGTGPEHCNACRNFYLEEIVNETAIQVCVGECPLGTYLIDSTGECEPCNEACPREVGCAGPLPYVNSTHGCLSCGTVELDRDDMQVRCHPLGCPVGTYRGLLEMALEELPVSTTVCRPCDELCAVCAGPGTDLVSCFSCRFAARVDEGCLEGCNATTEYLTQGRFCVQCDASCVGCTGPTAADCIECVDPENDAVVTCNPAAQQSQSSIDPGLIIGGVVGGVILAAAIAVVVILVSYGYYKSKYGSPKIIDMEQSPYPNPLYGTVHDSLAFQETLQPPKVAPNQARLIVTPESTLELQDVLGSGAFGTVYGGYWQPEGDAHRYHVAIKVLNEDRATPEASKELLKEGVVMASMDHDNVVRLYCVSMGKQMMVVSQFVPLGSLISYLKKHKDSLNAHTLLSFSVQIAQGMAYLEEKRMVHRDLAARNVLVQSPHLVKITDFGLTRIIEVGESHYTASGGKVPVRWMAPESLRQKVYTHKSDVWSYGITIWEVLTFGARPYKDKQARIILTLLEAGHRLEQPPTATIDLYALLLECWLQDPDSRPSFVDIVFRMKEMLDDPLRYILTTTDGGVTDYDNLPSNLTCSGEFAYENPLAVSLSHTLSPPHIAAEYDNSPELPAEYDNSLELPAEYDDALQKLPEYDDALQKLPEYDDALQKLPEYDNADVLDKQKGDVIGEKPFEYEDPLLSPREGRYISHPTTTTTTLPRTTVQQQSEPPHEYTYIDDETPLVDASANAPPDQRLQDGPHEYEYLEEKESLQDGPHEYEYLEEASHPPPHTSHPPKHTSHTPKHIPHPPKHTSPGPHEYEDMESTPPDYTEYHEPSPELFIPPSQRNQPKKATQRNQPKKVIQQNQPKTATQRNQPKKATRQNQPNRATSPIDAGYYEPVPPQFMVPPSRRVKGEVPGRARGESPGYEVPVDAKARTLASPQELQTSPGEYETPMDALKTL